MSYMYAEDNDVDVLIVLGAKLYSNAPGLLLISRLDAAIEYLRTRDDVMIVVSGGLGHDDVISEAEAMLRYLVAHGIEEKRIWKEDASTDTRENLAFSKALMREKGIDVNNIKIAIVTNDFHIFRSKIIAAKVGLNVIGVPAETPGLRRKVLHYLKEVYSLTKELVFGGACGEI